MIKHIQLMASISLIVACGNIVDHKGAKSDQGTGQSRSADAATPLPAASAPGSLAPNSSTNTNAVGQAIVSSESSALFLDAGHFYHTNVAAISVDLTDSKGATTNQTLPLKNNLLVLIGLHHDDYNVAIKLLDSGKNVLAAGSAKVTADLEGATSTLQLELDSSYANSKITVTVVPARTAKDLTPNYLAPASASYLSFVDAIGRPVTTNLTTTRLGLGSCTGLPIQVFDTTNVALSLAAPVSLTASVIAPFDGTNPYTQIGAAVEFHSKSDCSDVASDTITLPVGASGSTVYVKPTSAGLAYLKLTAPAMAPVSYETQEQGFSFVDRLTMLSALPPATSIVLTATNCPGIIIQLTDWLGQPSAASTPTTLELTTEHVGLHASSACDDAAAVNVTIPANASLVTYYVKSLDAQSGMARFSLPGLSPNTATTGPSVENLYFTIAP